MARSANRIAARRRRGFTLIEMIVAVSLLALLAGAAAPLATQQVRSNRIRLTQERMERIVLAIAGDPAAGTYGYVGDMGALPPALADLNTVPAFSGTPSFVTDARGFTYGWQGPYVALAGQGGTAFIDAWGEPFVYDGLNIQITSNGPDRLNGTADDLVFPTQPLDFEGELTVQLSGVDDTGADCPPVGEADVVVYRADGTNDLGNYQRSELFSETAPATFKGTVDRHVGLHLVEVSGLHNEFNGATASKLVRLGPRTTLVDLTLYASGPCNS